MNPSSNQNNSDSLFENSFEKQKEFETPEAVNDTVTHTPEHKKIIRDSWAEFYNLKSENNRSKVEIEQASFETQFSSPLNIFDNEPKIPDNKPVFIVEEQKGSGSVFEEAGIFNYSVVKESKRTITGLFGLFKELFVDTASLFIPKKEKRAEKAETDPEKAKAAAEKKAENQRKRNNMSVFIQAMQAQVGAIASPDGLRMDAAEKENINKKVKLNISYKGIKDSFGRLTVYAVSMLEREELDEEKKMKKVEKEQKMASVQKGPDLNMDKVAEGGFLSATGGQGAG